MAQGAIPIPGTRSVSRLDENFGAAKVDLTKEDLAEIRQILDSTPVSGDRYVRGVTGLIVQAAGLYHAGCWPLD